MATLDRDSNPASDIKIKDRDTNVSWYAESIGKQLNPKTRKLLEEYSHIPPNDVENHVLLLVQTLSQPLPFLNFCYIWS
jgi:hypothetical protein